MLYDPPPRPPLCEICESTKTVRVRPHMRKSDPPFVCDACHDIWCVHGVRDPAEIRARRSWRIVPDEAT